MIRTVPLVAAAGLDRDALGGLGLGLRAVAGSMMVKVEPRPGALSTATSPPSILQKCLVIARPSPVPP